MGRAVLLQHTQPDDGVHFDLLLERDTPGDRRAITFRLTHPIDLLAAAPFDAERIRDHRAVYLDYQGPVPAPGAANPDTPPGGRVDRLGAARCTIHIEAPDILDVTLDDSLRSVRFVARPLSPDADSNRWRFTPQRT